ncbi:Vacuolar protein sorting-associated protein 55 [Maublancomyces gigas]|uniref:Vacuolar protein sorting-associated protein 55 n=1 Tax=Discina gigas TaxID=1032678 RepID=A0ABR3G576_9PEZI
MAGLKTIIALSFVLAIGFLLVILSSALFGNYFPLFVVATYCLAPLPNAICSRCSSPDDFIDGAGNGTLSTSAMERVTDGILRIALPAVLAHSGIIQVPAMVMSVIGGLLIYGTIISFTMFFQEESDF